MQKFIENNPILRFLTVFVATFVIFGIFLVILFPILGSVLIWRWIVGLAAKWFQKEKLGKMVTSTSTVFASANVYTRKAVTLVIAVQVESPTLNLDNLKALVEDKCLTATIPNTNELLYPELKSILLPWMGFLFWAPCKTFDINNHMIRIEETDAPSYDPQDTEFLNKITTYLTRDRLWERNKPLWEIIVAENIIRHPDLGSSKSFFIVRCHHAIGDGWSLFKAASKLLESVKLPQFIERRSERVSSTFWRSLWVCLKLPFEVMDTFLTVMPDRTPIPAFQVSPSCEGPDVFGVMDEVFSLNRFKRLKTKLDVDFHSLILAGVASAVRQVYQDLGMKVPEHVKITYPLPMPGHPAKLRNHMSVGFILLPIGQPDPVKRLKLIFSLVQNGIRAGLPFPFFHIFRLMGSMPLFIVHKLRQNPRVAPILFTSIVGPAAPSYLEDKLVSDVKFAANIPHDGPGGYAYGVGIFTYCGRTNFGVTGLRNYFPDITHPQKFIERCVAEWEELERIADEKDDNYDSPMLQIV